MKRFFVLLAASRQ